MKSVTIGELSEEITLREGLEVWAGHWRGSLEDAVIAGTWSPPEEGETLLADDGSRQTWKVLRAEEDGWFRHDDLGGGWDEEGQPSAGGYVYLRVDARAPAVVLLHAMGSTVSYVNGEPRVGDHCWSGNADRFGYIRLPIALREGPNHLLFHCQSCELMVKLAPAPPHALLEVRDATLPDLIVGEETRTCGAVLVVNPSPEPRRGLTIAATCAGDADDNVPVGQSRMMKERLDCFHRDVVYQEHAEAGHWWTKSAMPIMDAAIRARSVQPRLGIAACRQPRPTRPWPTARCGPRASRR